MTVSINKNIVYTTKTQTTPKVDTKSVSKDSENFNSNISFGSGLSALAASGVYLLTKDKADSEIFKTTKKLTLKDKNIAKYLFNKALDKATTREDFLAIRKEILKMPNSPKKVALVEQYTRKYQDWSTRRINGNYTNHFIDNPNMAVKNMANDSPKIFTKEEADKLAAGDPEHIKVMSNGDILRITDTFEFIPLGKVAKDNNTKPIDKDFKELEILEKKRIDMNKSHEDWFNSRADLFGENMYDFNGWRGYTPKDQHHGAWKMHLYSIDEADWREMCDVIIPYLKEHDIDWKTFNATHKADCLNGTKQQGKAFTIYPKNNDDMAKIAKDLDYIIRKNKLETNNSHIIGDNQMGSTGRLFYRYEFKSGAFKDEILDLSPNSKDNEKYYKVDKYGHQIGGYYDSNRGYGKYLASDMTLDDDIWKDFDPTDPNAKYK